MTDSKKIFMEAPTGFSEIESDTHFQDIFAEIAGVTEYSVDGMEYVNLSFLSHRVAPFADEKGRPSLSRVGLKLVGSVTMTHAKAVALRDSLIANLRDEQEDGEG